MNVSATTSTHTPLNDLIQWNQPATTTASSQTTIQDAQQTLAQTPATILASVSPANTSLYGAAPAVDSLIGNISTSAGLSALAQVNATRAASSQISPFASASDAVAYGQSAQANVDSTILSGLTSSTGISTSSSQLLAAYYPSQAVNISSTPQINVTA